MLQFKSLQELASPVLLVAALGSTIVLAYLFYEDLIYGEFDWWIPTTVIILSLAMPIAGIYRRPQRSFRRQVLSAIYNHEIKVYYQPIVRLRDKKIIAAEALLRWPGSAISTECLIAKAEQTGLIPVITDYVTKRAIKDWNLFRDTQPDFCININVSAPELLSDQLIEQLDKSVRGLPVGAIVLEITERQSAPLDKIAIAIARLRAAGLKVYLDDFGAGYSSMSALLDLPVDGIKLDVSFIRSPNGLKAIRAINAIVEDMGIAVVVEGVETIAQTRSIMQISADTIVQGWAIGHPMEKEELLTRLKSSHRTEHPMEGSSAFQQTCAGRTEEDNEID